MDMNDRTQATLPPLAPGHVLRVVATSHSTIDARDGSRPVVSVMSPNAGAIIHIIGGRS